MATKEICFILQIVQVFYAAPEAFSNICIKRVPTNTIMLQGFLIIAVTVPSSRCVPWMKGNLIILLALIYSRVDGIFHSRLREGLGSEMPQIQSEINTLIYSSDV